MGEVFAGLAGWLIFINLVTYGAFAWDKRQAKHPGARRIPEQTLLNLALVGGGFGAKRAQTRLRHKSYKQPFGRRLNLSIWASVVVPILVFGWVYWPR